MGKYEYNRPEVWLRGRVLSTHKALGSIPSTTILPSHPKSETVICSRNVSTLGYC